MLLVAAYIEKKNPGGGWGGILYTLFKMIEQGLNAIKFIIYDT